MNSSSRLPAFLAGLVLGLLVAASAIRWLAPRSANTTAPTAAAESSLAPATAPDLPEITQARERITRLEADNLRLSQRVQALSQAADAKPAVPKAGAKTAAANPFAAMFGGDENSTNETAKAMRGMMEAAVKQQLDGKVRQMKTRLNLSAEQEAAVRDILGQQFGAGQAIAQKLMAGKATQEDLAEATQSQLSPTEQLKAVLSPEQQQAYEEMQHEENRNNARLMANAEMLQLQGSLGLSQEQQDSVFKALFTATEEQMGGLGNDPQRAMDFRGNLDRKLASLKGVLSEEQFKAYEEIQLQQLKLIESFLPKDGQPADLAIPQIQILEQP